LPELKQKLIGDFQEYDGIYEDACDEVYRTAFIIRVSQRISVDIGAWFDAKEERENEFKAKKEKEKRRKEYEKLKLEFR
jgi:hypothetical protein